MKGGAALSLEKCMNQAVQEIPKSRHKLTPVYLGATAGMRLLNMSKPKESDEVLKEVGEKLKSYPFNFKGASILSGQEEGAYGWVTINYLLEKYIKAFSAFFYTHSFLWEATNISIKSIAHLENAARVICNMSIQAMSDKFNNQGNRLKDYCPISVFIRVLLVRGYGFDDFTFPQISFQKKAGDTSVGWSLGYMLSLSNLLPAEDLLLKKSLHSGAWSVLIFLFCVLLLTALIFLMRAICKKKADDDMI